MSPLLDRILRFLRQVWRGLPLYQLFRPGQRSAGVSSVGAAEVDLVTWAFEKQKGYSDHVPLYIDADDPTKFLTRAQTEALVRKLIAGLKAEGLRDGDCVLLHTGNQHLYAPLTLGVLGAGGVLCGSNPAYHAFELEHLIKLSQPRMILTTERALPVVLEVAVSAEIQRNQIFLVDEFDSPTKRDRSVRHLDDLLCHGEQQWPEIRDRKELEARLSFYYSTSGTTGLPKLAAVSHHALVTQMIAVEARTAADAIRLAYLPFFHIFGANIAIWYPLRRGNPLFVMARFKLDELVEYISKYHVTEVGMSPPVVHMLNRYSKPLRPLLKTVRYMLVGGASIDAEAIRELKSHLDAHATVAQVWGMTELGIAATFRHGEQDDTGAVGRMLDGFQAKIVDDSGKALEDGETGQVLVHSPGIMTGYRYMAPLGEEREWYNTGDLGQVKNGKLYIVGRTKELIKVKGWQVAPAELEAVILQHPQVKDCAVVSVKSADGSHEVPRAYVVKKEEPEAAAVTPDMIYDLVKQMLCTYKRLDGGVIFCDAIPRTASGKIQRFKLVEVA